MELNALKETIYYSSHGISMSWDEFIDLEVLERDNYTIKEVEEWINKYNIDIDKASVIWVCPNKYKAHAYNLDGDEYDDYMDSLPIPEEDLEVVEIPSSLGFIIPESDDGSDGYLFVYNKKGK